MRVIESVEEMQTWSEERRREGKRIALVPTMGFLHEGHLELVREGKRRDHSLVVSVFVNPGQFGPQEDFSAYPRDFQRDRKLLQEEGVGVLFAPTVEAVYPPGFQTSVDVEKLSSYLCGARRPGHFKSVATVVTKLLNMVRPHTAVFGLKDYQQFLVVRQLVMDLNFDVDIVGVPTVREKDGLALSSRNHYLRGDERKAAGCLSRALQKAQEVVGQGLRGREEILSQVAGEITREPLARLDYAELCHPTSLEPVATLEKETLLALAVWVGGARLIDNAILRF